jgi:PAS domain S-box-containing protein
MYYVLYVDDEPSLLEVAKLFLERTSEIDVTTALSAREGLDLLKKNSFDAIVADYQMPEMDGIAFLKEVRSVYGDIPFILFTGRGREDVVIEAISNGVDFYLQKGGDPRSQFAELAHKIKTAIARKRAIEKLKNSEARLRQIIDLVPHMIFAKDREGHYILANRALAEEYNTTVEELEGKSQAQFHKDESELRRMLEDDREVIATGETKYISEEPFVDANGRHHVLQTVKVPFCTPGINEPAVLGVGIDITERKQTELELRAINEQLAAAQEELKAQYEALVTAQADILNHQQQIDGIAATVPGVVYQAYLRPDGRMGITYINENTAERIFGLDYSDRDLFRWFVGHVHPDDRTRLIESVDDAMKKIENWNFEGRFVKPSGEMIWFQGIGSPASTGPERVYSGVLLDITERKRQEHIIKTQLALGLRLQEIHTITETLDACLSAAIEISGMDAGGIYLVDDRSGSVDLAGFSNLSEEFLNEVSHYTGDSVNARIVREGKSLYMPARAAGVVPDPIQEREGIAAIGIIPISFDGRTIACLNVTSHRVEDIPVSARIALETIATQIGAAIGRIRSEESLQERENKYRAVIETTHTGFVIIDSLGRVIDANPEYIRLTGHSGLEEIAGRNVLEWTADYDKEKNRDAIRQCVREELIRNLEIDYTDASGNITPIEINATVIRSGGSFQILTLCRDISARRKIQSELQESEQKYRTLVEHTQDGVFIVQNDRLVFYNSKFAEMAGYSEDELIGHPITEMIAPEDREMVLSRHQERIAGKRLPESYEFSVLRKDGTTRVRMKMLVGVGMFKGRPATIGTLHNISEDRRREEALRESEERHRLLTDNASDVIWTIDLAGHFTYVSPSVEKLCGHTAEETLKKSIDQVLTESSLAIVRKELTAAGEEVRAGRRFQGFRGELEQIRKDGSTIWTDVTATGIYNNSNEFIGILGISRDITDRKRLEQALVESELKVRSIFNSTSDAIQIIEIVADGSPGKYIEINDAGCRMLQYSREEMLEKSPLDIATEHDGLERAREDLQAFGHTTFETTYRRKDGSVIPVEVNAQLATIAGKTVAVSVVRDVTERRRPEDALRLANHKLNLLSSVTRHDVLNLLMALKGYVDLSGECSIDETCRDFHKKEEELIARIERQILFTKEYQDIGNQAPCWHNVMRSIVTSIDGLNLSGIDLLAEDLEDLEILADRLLQKVFFNLVENSLRHGGKGLKKIRFSSSRSGNNLVIVCEDDGTGVSPDEKEKIFDRGYGKNRGFGLFLIREILAITGITIEEDGVAGTGARFRITVPKGAYRFREPRR